LLFVYPVLTLFEVLINKQIRIVRVASTRFGAMATQLEYYLRKKHFSNDFSRTLYLFISGRPINFQLFSMYKRQLRILEIPFLHKIIWLYTPVLMKTRFYSRYYHPFIFNWIKKYSGILSFNSKEEKRGRAWLEEKGIGKKDWYICVFSRDEVHLDHTYPKSLLYGSVIKNDWTYYNYRNAEINTFLLAIQYIIKMGGFVIRMGSEVKDPVQFEHEKFIDYPLNDRSDFLDIYIPAQCRFFLGTLGGSCELFNIFDKPRVIANVIPPGLVPWGKNDIYIPKRIKNSQTGEYLSFPHIVKKDMSNIRDYSKHDEREYYTEKGYEFEDNNPEEILDVCQEMLERQNGSFSENNNYKILLEIYYRSYPSDHDFSKLKTPIGHNFLLTNRQLFDSSLG